ncbi:MAG: peptidoglycan DD-metalloendopeptidase family protein [Candidatus Dojkabacteria bacterium]|nr:MAG: peptidoglycan DD-metalloendopeptidase family protein [Candidatus Dojkabacteria bacterium]
MLRSILITAISAILYLICAGVASAEDQRFILYPTQDTLTKRWYPTSSSYLTRDLSVGYDGVIPRRETRTYLKFDYSVIRDEEVRQENLVSAKLYLSEYRDMAGEEYTVELFETAALWEDRNLNWSNQPALPDVRYQQVVNQNIGAGVEVFDVTEIFRSQFADESRWPRGYGIKVLDEALPGALFWSKDCVNHLDSPRCNLNQIPYLEVVYGEELPVAAATELTPVDGLHSADRNILFEWKHEQQDGVEYQLMISRNSSAVYQSEWVEAKSLTYQFEREGEYEWIVKSRRRNSDLVSATAPSRLTLDWSSPGAVRILYPTNGLLTNKHVVPVELSGMEADSEYKLYINEAEISLPVSSVNTDKEGENLLKVVGVDSAGNSSESSVSFITDWTPPSTPVIELLPDVLAKSISAKISVDADNAVRVLENGVIIKNISGGELSQPLLLVEQWEPGKEYSYSASSLDAAGNQSERSVPIKFVAPTEAVLGTESTAEELRSVLGSPLASRSSTANRCKVEANLDLKTLRVVSCKFGAPNLKQVSQIKVDQKNYWINAVSQFKRNVTLDIDYYKCKIPHAFTTFCLPFKDSSEKVIVTSIGAAKLVLNNKSTREYQSSNVDENIHSLFSNGETYKGKAATIAFELNLATRIKGGFWLQINGTSKTSNSSTINQIEDRTLIEKYFKYPFAKMIGVTQWWGKTAFNDHHTGIDFGSTREKLFATANGKIGFVGWDSYYGPCLSGGNILRIDHGNGMSSLYFHLENYKKAGGIDWRVGENIKKGDQVGVSGNSGAYNCQPLAYHLHFELRKSKDQKDNTDPVPHLDVDWSKIPTLGANANPGRLTGNNPHPSY